ncbi:MAG: lipid A export permease/ATP-binding protein MsbA, partial [Steroidobacteraceae bacterium]
TEAAPGASPGASPGAADTYRRLLGYARRHAGAFGLGIVGSILYAASMVSFGPFAQVFGDRTFTHPDPRMIWVLPLAIVGLFTVRGIGDFTRTYAMGHVARKVVSELRQEMFERALRLPLAYFDRNSAAELLSKLTYNAEQIGHATTTSVVVLVTSSLTICGLIGYLLRLNLYLTLIALGMAPLVSWLTTRINHYFRRYSRRIQSSMGDVTRVAQESFESPRLIKVYNAEPHLDAQFEAVNEHNRRSYMRLVLTKGLSNPIVQFLTSIGAALVFSYALASKIHGHMTTGELLGYFTALSMTAQPLRQLVGVAGPLQQGVAAAESIFELLDVPAEPAGGSFAPARVRGEVDFQQVSFGYQGAPSEALRNVTLHVAAGERIAIVGRSGSGKSTLVSLLPRFYDVAAGRVCIDGHDIREYDTRCLREQIAVVSQDITLFNDTIRNNIAFGRSVSPEAMERAVEAAHVREFALAQAQGLDTLVGDRGTLLSGGQRQRIAIARALIKDAPILILDEATSALDTEAERHIQAALGELIRDRTTFVIAHRLSTVEQADRIVVLDAGAIVECGTHAELLAGGGLYSQLHHLQFSD